MSRVVDLSARAELASTISWKRVDRWPNQMAADMWSEQFPVVVETPKLDPHDQRDRIEEFCQEHFGKYGEDWATYQTTRMVDDHTRTSVIITVGFKNEADLSFFLIGLDRS